MLIRLNQVLLLLVGCTVAAASAHASFGSFGPWEGTTLLLAFVLTLAYGLIVDLVLLAKGFRHRAVVVVASITTTAVVLLLAVSTASPAERAVFFRLFPGESGSTVFMLISAVLIPFLLIAPIVQHLAMRQGRPSPAWLRRWMALQPALVPVFIILAFTNQYYRQSEYEAGLDEGRAATAGELSALLGRAEQRHERIWGTGLTYPWRGNASEWNRGLATGMDQSAPIATNEPLSAPDRTALRTLLGQRFRRYAVPHLRAKLLWDSLEPGGFAMLDSLLRVSEEAFPVLLERLEEYGEARFCPGGRMMEADRAALNALIQARSAGEMRPPWDSFQQRVDRLCSGPG